VREPAADRLGRQPLLRNLRLRDLVERLAHGLTAARQQGETTAHREDAERDRQRCADREIDDRLVNRHVERAEVDGDPLLELELVRRVERSGDHLRGSAAKYSISETPSVSEYVST